MICEVLGFYSDVAEDSTLLGFLAPCRFAAAEVSKDRIIYIFRFKQSKDFRTYWTLTVQMNVLRSLETSVSVYLSMLRNVSEDLNSRMQCFTK